MYTNTLKIISKAEQQLYLTLLNIAQTHPMANEWLACLPKWLADIKDKSKYAHAPAYQSAVERLPTINKEHNHAVNLNADAITINIDWSKAEFKQTQALLKNLMPWRKGPFQIGNDEHQLYIDTEWNSDWKWKRVRPHLSGLKGRRILDVGGGSGYHGWRMAGSTNKKAEEESEGAETVIIIDPSCLFYHQFMAIRHFVGGADIGQNNNYRTHYIPVPLEALPEHSQLFDTVFSMGVLYHRASPFEHLNLLRGQLATGGELVLETLVVEGDETTVLVPPERYAKMNNVYFLPSVAALSLWLKKAGFTDVRCVDIEVTSVEEQRATEWMDYQSLSDFLDPNDPSKTVEGHPAPMRAVLVAKR